MRFRIVAEVSNLSNINPLMGNSAFAYSE